MLGDAVTEAQKIFSKAIIDQHTPEATEFLRAVDAKYPYYKRLEAASVAAKANDGVFTGNQLLNADARLSKRAGKSDIAAGQGLYQDLAGMMNRLTSKMPNSGSPERGTAVGLMAGLAAGAVPMPVIAGIGGLTGLYTNAGQRFINTVLSKRPASAQAISNILQQYAPTAAGRLPILNGNQ